MKTTKHNLKAIALGVALAVGSVSALAANPVNPSKPGLDSASAAERASILATFEPSEKLGLALVESSLSLIAAREHIDSNSLCPTLTYSLSVFVDNGIDGSATITGGGEKLVLHGVLDDNKKHILSSLGTFVDVTADAGSLYGAAITDYEGDHRWSHTNSIFLDHASWIFKHPQFGGFIPYDEHSIKDYYKRIETVAGEPESWEYDWGLEVITKDDLPVAKWTELSWYRQQDGNDGIVKVKKLLLAPNTKKALCRIVYNASGFSPFEYSGTVTVSKP